MNLKSWKVVFCLIIGAIVSFVLGGIVMYEWFLKILKEPRKKKRSGYYNDYYKETRAYRGGFVASSIIFETRSEANETLSALVSLIKDYSHATLSDLYDLVGMDSNFEDNKYGWTSLKGVDVRRTGHGYIITLPKPVSLD